jgi:hypothetical protein
LGILLEKAGLSVELSDEILAGPWENSSVVKISDDIAILNSLDFFYTYG